MGKSRKKRKQKRSTPNLSPLIQLRPRLDQLLSAGALAEKDPQALRTDLDDVFKGLKPSEFLPVLLRAYPSAPEQVQARLDEMLPEWLGERGYTGTLLDLLKKHRIDSKGEQRAQTWLVSAGADVSVLQEEKEEASFYGAYSYYDESQGMVVIYWYTDHRRYDVGGMSFLLDFNPPWEGAVKDIIVLPRRPPERAVQEYVGMSRQHGMLLEPISAAEAKKEVLEGLLVNRREKIRLPSDLISARKLFLKHVLSLPDMPETPRFTAQDFEALQRTGKAPEAIRHYEQTVGHRVRMEDGEEVLVMDHLPEDDEW